MRFTLPSPPQNSPLQTHLHEERDPNLLNQEQIAAARPGCAVMNQWETSALYQYQLDLQFGDL